MKHIRIKGLDSDFLVRELQLTPLEEPYVQLFIDWAKAMAFWRDHKDNRSADEARTKSIHALQQAIPDYERRMFLLNKLHEVIAQGGK